MNITNPNLPSNILASSGEVLAVEIVPIGVWDMDTDSSVFIPYINVPYKVVMVQAFIFMDGGSHTYPIDVSQLGTSFHFTEGLVFVKGDTDEIQITRRSGGLFDAAAFSSILINRGNIFVWTIAG